MYKILFYYEHVPGRFDFVQLQHLFTSLSLSLSLSLVECLLYFCPYVGTLSQHKNRFEPTSFDTLTIESNEMDTVFVFGGSSNLPGREGRAF